MNILRLLYLTLVYVAISLLLGQIAVLGILYAKGNLNRETWFQVLAVANDVDLYRVRRDRERAIQPIPQAEISYEEVIMARIDLMLDQDLREMASGKGEIDIDSLKVMLAEERQSFANVRTAFEERLAKAQLGAADPALRDVRRQIESVTPRLAKDQLLRILDDPNVEPDQGLQFVVTLIKSVPPEKRKKILAEFKNADQERLHEILRQIRIGVPDVELIRQVREQLEQFQSRS